jgi:putative two-component system response regulator
MNSRGLNKVLVVDDIPENIDVIAGILNKDNYEVMAARSGEAVMKMVQSLKLPDIILLDVMMPDMDGYEVCKKLKSNILTSSIPIIFVTAKHETKDEQHGLDLGAVDYITKPINPAILKARIKTHLAVYNHNMELERKVQQRTQKLHDTQLQIIQRLGRAAEFKDNETGLHVIRMSHYSRIIAEKTNSDKVWSELIFTTSPMHDVGKIGIPDKIILKPGKLDEPEWEIMKQHCEIGAEIIGDHSSNLLQMAKEIALTHHEKWDGSGYPNALSGNAIPVTGRIVALADVFDALTSERPYKSAWPVDKAVKLIEENSGKHFDPNLVIVFKEVLTDILAHKKIYAESSATKETNH